MRHRKHTFKIGRTGAHKRCLLANMLKSLILNEQIQTTVAKAKELRRFADKIITLAKGPDALTAKRRAIGQLMVTYNTLTPQERKVASLKAGEKRDTSSHNDDRNVINKLFDDLAPRFAARQGGYTRVIRMSRRIGDNAETCIIQYLPAESTAQVT